MGLLSFIYSVLGYNLCTTLFIAYLMFDYVLGALATFGARYVMESKSGGAYDFYIRWIRVDYGWTELTLTIGPITFKNPKKFKITPFLIKIDRISCRVNPRSFLDWVIDNPAEEKWYDIEPSDDKPLKEGEKSAQVKLSIELHGVKATED